MASVMGAGLARIQAQPSVPAMVPGVMMMMAQGVPIVVAMMVPMPVVIMAPVTMVVPYHSHGRGRLIRILGHGRRIGWCLRKRRRSHDASRKRGCGQQCFQHEFLPAIFIAGASVDSLRRAA